MNPVWDEFYRFLVFNAKYQELNLEVSIYFAYLSCGKDIWQCCRLIVWKVAERALVMEVDGGGGGEGEVWCTSHNMELRAML